MITDTYQPLINLTSRMTWIIKPFIQYIFIQKLIFNGIFRMICNVSIFATVFLNYGFFYGNKVKFWSKFSSRIIQQQTAERKVREKSRECHNHKPQPFPDTKRKRKRTKPNKRKSNKRTKSTKISSLFPTRGNRNAKRIENYKNKITQSKT